MLLLPLVALLSGGADSTHIAHTLPIDEVVVEGHRPLGAPFEVTASHSRITSHEIEQSMQPSLLPLLGEEVPGLFVTSRGGMGYGLSTGAAGAISIRGIGGAPTTGVLVVIDGQPQYSGLMGHPIADNCLAHGAATVEVVRGPASVRYGSQAMGGVVHITTHHPSDEGLQLSTRLGGGSYGTIESQLRLRWADERFSLSGSSYYNRTDGHRPEMAFAQGGGRIGLQYRPSSRWQLGIDLSADRFGSSNPGPVMTPLIDNDARILRGTATLSLGHRHRRASGEGSLFWSGGRHLINDGHSPQAPPADYLFHSYDHILGLTLREELSLFRGNRVLLGADLFEMGGRTEHRFRDGHTEPMADERENEGALFVEMTQRFGRLQLQGGVRYDHHSQAGSVWIPQGGLRVELPLNFTLHGAAGKGFRFPTLREMYLFASRNPHLDPEEVVQYEVGIRQELLRGRLRYALTLFLAEGDNAIRVVMVEGRPQNQNTGPIHNRGLEAEVELQPLRGLRLAADYSLIRMRHPQLGVPAGKLAARVQFERGRWLLSASAQHIRGLYTRLESSSAPALREQYTLLNLRLWYRPTKWLRLWARGENLLGERYEINYGFPMPKATFTGGIEIQL